MVSKNYMWDPTMTTREKFWIADVCRLLQSQARSILVLKTDREQAKTCQSILQGHCHCIKAPGFYTAFYCNTWRVCNFLWGFWASSAPIEVFGKSPLLVQTSATSALADLQAKFSLTDFTRTRIWLLVISHLAILIFPNVLNGHKCK